MAEDRSGNRHRRAPYLISVWLLNTDPPTASVEVDAQNLTVFRDHVRFATPSGNRRPHDDDLVPLLQRVPVTDTLRDGRRKTRRFWGPTIGPFHWIERPLSSHGYSKSVVGNVGFGKQGLNERAAGSGRTTARSRGTTSRRLRGSALAERSRIRRRFVLMDRRCSRNPILHRGTIDQFRSAN